jgi:hypothetical protein
MLLLPFITDALAADAVLGRSAVATAMADPLTVMLKKSLLVLINSSFLLVGGRPVRRAYFLKSRDFLEQAVWVKHEFLRNARIKVPIALGRLIQGDDCSVDDLCDRQPVI